MPGSLRLFLSVLLLLVAAGCSAHPAISGTPLLATEPDIARDADLRVLAEWLKDSAVVGVGERVHGTHELHRLAHRLFAYLVEHEGFSVFALEVDEAHAALLDEYVRGSRDDLEDLLAKRWWASEQFYDEALVDLLRWMRKHNETAARPVRFVGYDLKQPDLAMQLLLAELRRLDPGAAAEAEERFEAIRRLGGFGGVPSFLGYSASLTLPLPAGDGSVRRLRVQLQVRSTGLSRGSAGFSLRMGQEPPRMATLDGASPGKSLEATLDVPGEASEVVLTIFHRGNGTVWLDDLRVDLDGVPLPADVADAVLLPPQMPHLQVMDYTAAVEGRALRIDCDPRLDEALSAARRIVELTSGHAAWLRQLARLVVQATEWRTLAQPNRDVFLAENVAWLAREANPGGRVLVLAHTSHTERIPARMGAYLAETFGDGYQTVSMLPLEGEYRGFEDVATLTPEAPLRVFPLAERDARYAASLGRGDLILKVQDAAETAPDVAILVRRVGASRPIEPPSPRSPPSRGPRSR